MEYKKGAYEIMHIQKNNDFYNLVMKKDFLQQKQTRAQNYARRHLSPKLQQKLRDGIKKNK
jgi:hypothetical protein